MKLKKAPERELVAILRAVVNGGSSFAKALSQHPREFSNIYVAVIGAGEQSGNLGLVLALALTATLARFALTGRLAASQRVVRECQLPGEPKMWSWVRVSRRSHLPAECSDMPSKAQQNRLWLLRFFVLLPLATSHKSASQAATGLALTIL
jgi:hypothetical protein